MPLAPGSRLGSYEVTGPLGAGGMGEVYRARDLKLDREVALKVLPEAVADDPERLARFEREAKVLAALNHPNIAQIYGLVEAGSTRGLVMELVPGRTVKGPLPLATALDYAQQIAAALEAAHEKGIIHRDLKPANIMVTPAGVVKVLDFGLAAQVHNASRAHAEDSPTFTMSATQAGVILGTAAYMSPEQARGEAVDKRTDIWAFGAVLYEMVAGRGLFEGKTVADLLAAVLVAEPDLSKVPAKVRNVLARCLEKDARKRLRDIGDAMALVDEGAPVRPESSRAPWIAAGVMALVAIGVGVALWRTGRSEERPQVRLDVDLGQDVSLAGANGSTTVILSPDGMRLTYLASVAGGPPKLYARRLDQTGATELQGTKGANSPFFSPDGHWVGFSIGETLYKVPLDGGPTVVLGSPGASLGSSWGEDGVIITAVLGQGFSRTPASGGGSSPMVKLAEGEFTFTAPQLLPGGKAILFTSYPEARSDPERARVEVMSLVDHRRTVIVQGASARYLATTKSVGYILYTLRNELMAIPFDVDHLEKRGPAVLVAGDVGFEMTTAEARFDLSKEGTLVYRKAGAVDEALSVVQWLDSAGNRESAVRKAGIYRDARLSPDGKRLVAEVKEEGVYGVQVYDLQRETWTPIASGGRIFPYSIWSGDGQFLILGSLTGLYWVRADGANRPQTLTMVQAVQSPWSVTPDGKRLIYGQGYGEAGHLWTAPLEVTGGQLKGGAPERFLKDDAKETRAMFSPDGKWLAFESDASGADEVYVRAFPDSGAQWKISASGGHAPIWSVAGQDLLYQAGDQMMAVGYSVRGGTLEPQKARVWSAKIGGTATDLSLDGKRLLVVVPVDRPNVSKPEHDVVLFENFLGYLRQHVPER